MNTTAATDVGAVVLAGGLARRMGGDDKGLIPLAGRPMVAHVIAAIQPAVAALVINANRNHDRYAQYGVPIVKDAHADYPGPLAGLAAGIEALGTSLVFMCPCDSPFVSAALVNTLVDGIGDADVSAAHDGDRLQPVFAVVRSHCAQSLLAFLASGERVLMSTIDKLASCEDPFDHLLPVDEARQRLLDTLQPVAFEKMQQVPLADASGRVLAQAITAPFDVPPEANSAMDGYAIVADDIPTEGETRLRIVGTAWAGRPYGAAVARGEAVRIFTGAVMPAGADTVVIQEHVRADEQSVHIDSKVVSACLPRLAL